MRVGIIQSNYIPWRGYFDFINSVDLFIFHDDVQYTKNDWRNRNKIKTTNGAIWLTVPVNHKSTSQLICDTPIDYSHRWNKRHIHQLEQWYGKAPFFDRYSKELHCIISNNFKSISDLNITLCRWIMEELQIKTPSRLSSELQPQGTKTARLVDLLNKVGATSYLSGPAAKNYLDHDLLRRHGIRLEYKCYDYPPYPQLWGAFIGEVTILDLLFNAGPESRKYLKSRTPNESVMN